VIAFDYRVNIRAHLLDNTGTLVTEYERNRHPSV
jgi:hypothetical protein